MNRRLILLLEGFLLLVLKLMIVHLNEVTHHVIDGVAHFSRGFGLAEPQLAEHIINV